MAGPSNIDNLQLAELQKISNNIRKMVSLLGGTGRQTSGRDTPVRASAHSQRGRNERAAVGGSATIPRSLLDGFGKLEKATGKVTQRFEELARAQSAYLNAINTSTRNTRNADRQNRQNDRNDRNDRNRNNGSSGNNNNNRNNQDNDDGYPGDRRHRRRPTVPTARTPRGALVHGVGAHVGSTITGQLRDWVRRSPFAGIATVSGSFALLTDGVKALIREFHDLRQTGFRSHIWELNKESVMLGISMKSMVEVLNSSKAQLNTIGLKPFLGFIDKAQDSAMALGMSTDEATKFIASSITSASKAGVKMLDAVDMKKVVDSNEKAFAAMRATTNVTSEEFMKMTENLLANNDVQKMMLGMNKQQKIQFMEGMNLERQRLSQLQLTVDQQAKILTSMMELSGMKVKDRFEGAAKFAGAASMLGMDSGSTQRALALIQKKNRSADENSQLREILTQFKALKEERRLSGLVDENMVDAIEESLPPTIAKAIDDMAPAVQSKQAGTELTPKTLADKITETTDGKLTIAFSKIYGTFDSVFSNPLTKIVLGITGIGLSLLQLTRIARSVINIERNTVHPSGATRHDVRQRRLGRLRNQQGGLVRRAARGAIGAGRDILGAATGRRALSSLGRVGTMAAGAGILGSLYDVVDGMMTDAKEISMKSDVTGGLLQGGLALLGGPWTLGITAVTKGLTDGFKGWQKASEFFATDAPTTGQKFAAATGGFLHGITFGMLDGQKASNFLYNSGDTISNAMSSAWGFVTKMGSYVADGFSYLIDLPKKITGYFVDWYATMAKAGTKILGYLGFDGAEKAANAKIDAAKAYLTGTPADGKPTAVRQPVPAAEVQPQPRQLGTQQQTINTSTEQPKAASDAATAPAMPQNAPASKDQAQTSNSIQQQKDVSLSDVLAKLAELVELQKADTGINKEHLNAVKDLAPNKFGLSPSAFVRT